MRTPQRIAVLATMLALGGTAYAATQYANVRAMDVAGVRLGMSPAEARAALIAKGMTPKAKDEMNLSWDSLVEIKAASRNGTPIPKSSFVPGHTVATGPAGEYIYVSYGQTPTGSEVSAVTYSIPSDRIDQNVYVQGVMRKYGAASFAGKAHWRYCTSGDDKCPTIGGAPTLAYLFVYAGYNGNRLRLEEGPLATRAREKAIELAALAKLPKASKPSF